MKVRTGKMGMNHKRVADLYEQQAQELPSDQIYRELMVNAMEACIKQKKLTPEYEGEIYVDESEVVESYIDADNPTDHDGKLH